MIVENILISLFITLAVELLIYGLMDRFKFLSFMVMFGTNVVLNTTMNIILSFMPSYQAYLTTLIIFEVSVIIIEGVVFKLVSNKNIPYSLLAAFTANVLSFTVGYFFNLSHVMDKKGAFIYSSLITLIVIVIETSIALYLFLAPRLFRYYDNRDNDRANKETQDQQENR